MPLNSHCRMLRPALLASAVALLGGLPLSTIAQEFRIETEIYVGDETVPASRTVTLFEESAVYDFTEDQSQVVVYRRSASQEKGQFILLDSATEQRTDVDVGRVESFVKKIEKFVRNQEDEQASELMKFCAQPVFEESFDEETGELLLKHDLWTYRAATVQVESKGALQRFREFTDNYARLNTILYPNLNNLPLPGPRLSLNRALSLHQVVPVEIRRTIKNAETQQVRASHLFSWRLSREDRARLDEVRRDLANYKKVDNKTFLTTGVRGGQKVVRGQSK